MRKANVSICVYTKISNKNPDKHIYLYIANCIHLDLPTHPYFLNLLVSFMFHVFFRKKPTWKKTISWYEQTCHLHSTTFCRFKFAWGSPLNSTLRRFPEEMGGPGTVVACMCHMFAFFKASNRTTPIACTDTYKMCFFLAAKKERSIKYAIPFKISRVFTLPIWVWANHPKLLTSYILHVFDSPNTGGIYFMTFVLPHFPPIATFCSVSDGHFQLGTIWDLDFAIWSCIDFMPFAADLAGTAGNGQLMFSQLWNVFYIWASQYMCNLKIKQPI